jgi:hypothetical protein
MITSAELLAVGKAAIVAGATPAALSRATSTLYYTLFHALLEEARRRVHGCTNSEILRRYSAAFDHGALAEAATQIRASSRTDLRTRVKGGKPAAWTALLPENTTDPNLRVPTADLLDVCETFVKLQGLRLQADYHAEWEVEFADAQQYLLDTERALAAWGRCAATDESVILLFGALGVFQFR